MPHSLLEMVRGRVFGILAGYEDQNDHDALRSDGLFKLIAGRLPTDDDLASQPNGAARCMGAATASPCGRFFRFIARGQRSARSCCSIPNVLVTPL